MIFSTTNWVKVGPACLVIGPFFLILPHGIYGSTADATAYLVPYLQEQGYELVTVSELVEAKHGEVPENSTCVGVPARVVRINNKKVALDLDQIHIPDPVSQEICKLYMEIDRLKAELDEIKQTSDKGAPEK